MTINHLPHREPGFFEAPGCLGLWDSCYLAIIVQLVIQSCVQLTSPSLQLSVHFGSSPFNKDSADMASEDFLVHSLRYFMPALILKGVLLIKY